MRCLVQRVLSASVSVSGESLGRIERGYLILLGVNNQDTEAVADKMLKKNSGCPPLRGWKRKDQSFHKRHLRLTPYRKPVHALCGYQKRKSSELYSGRRPCTCKCPLWIFSTESGRSRHSDSARTIRGRYEGKPCEWRALYHHVWQWCDIVHCKSEGSFLVQDGKPCNLQARLVLNKKGDSEIVRCLLF